MKTAVGVFGLCDHRRGTLDVSQFDERYPTIRCARCPAEWTDVGDRYLTRPVRQGHWPTGTGWTNSR